MLSPSPSGFWAAAGGFTSLTVHCPWFAYTLFSIRKSSRAQGGAEIGRSCLQGNIRSLHHLWDEYSVGLGGNKPAKLFTPAERGRCKFTYSRRKLFWDLCCRLIRSGLDAQLAIDRIYAVYGPNKPVTDIIKAIRLSKKNGSWHPSLAV